MLKQQFPPAVASLCEDLSSRGLRAAGKNALVVSSFDFAQELACNCSFGTRVG